MEERERLEHRAALFPTKERGLSEYLLTPRWLLPMLAQVFSEGLGGEEGVCVKRRPVCGR